MKITRGQIIARGLTNRCPNCGGRTLFKAGTFFEVNKECPQCGFEIERDDGFFIGSMSLNYGVTLVFFFGPVLLLAYDQVIGVTLASVVAGVGALLFPVLFYRSSRSWWLMNYYFFVPQHLPANRAASETRGNENS
jgi:DNA-directed RNA polymerase subunit RPC12/RpoP